MATDGPMVTPTDALTLAQWFSPSFPVGAFAYSHGLEWAVESGAVKDPHDTLAFVLQVLESGAGWNDAILLSQAYQASDDETLSYLDATCRALAASKERLQETMLQGQAFCQAISAGWAEVPQDLTYPVAVGYAARAEGLPLALTAQFYLQSFQSNLVAAAMRLVPLGQSEGQAVIKDLNARIPALVERAVVADLEDLSSIAFLADIAAMKHETQYSRIFRT